MSLLALTSYYNPLCGELRRRNYHTFRRHLGVPLMTVEWAQAGAFELRAEDAEHLIQVSGGDLLWQKERLLNIGIDKARALGVEKIVFLDSDIVFENPRWHEAVARSLDTSNFIQCFETADYLPRGEYGHLSREALCAIRPEHTLPSLFKFLAEGKSLYHGENESFWTEATAKLRGNPGMATGISLQRLPDWRLYEGNIVGGGDLATVATVCGRTEELFATREHSPRHQQDLLSWASARDFSGARIGYTAGRVLHLWHGEIKDRQYQQRYAILTRHGYDPARDIVVSPGGLLGFAANSGELQRSVEAYIRSRKDA